MKCPECKGKPGLQYWHEDTPHDDGKCDICESRGWVPFWTPAERAGLKAMGRVALSCINGSYTHGEPIRYAICVYVKAARAAKEEK